MCGQASAIETTVLPPLSVLEHITDVHCHPTDSRISAEDAKNLPMRICAMATRSSDQDLVRDLANANPEKVIPCFGYHPWFTHWISLSPGISKEDHYKTLFLEKDSESKPDTVEAFNKLLQYLPEPTPLDAILTKLRQNLSEFPNAMLGEVGLDRACRVPYIAPSPPPYAEHDNRRDLSPFTIPLPHQLIVLEAQLDVAVEMGRNVSCHSVKSQQATADLLIRMKTKHGREAWEAISVDLHSCGFSAQSWLDVERKHVNVYLSLSTVINSRSPAHKDLIASCAPHRILVESDFNNIRDLPQQTWEMVRTIAEVKKWKVEEDWLYAEQHIASEDWGVVKRLEDNWNRFQKAKHTPIKRNRDRRKLTLDSDESDSEL